MSGTTAHSGWVRVHGGRWDEEDEEKGPTEQRGGRTGLLVTPRRTRSMTYFTVVFWRTFYSKWIKELMKKHGILLVFIPPNVDTGTTGPSGWVCQKQQKTQSEVEGKGPIEHRGGQPWRTPRRTRSSIMNSRTMFSPHQLKRDPRKKPKVWDHKRYKCSKYKEILQK